MKLDSLTPISSDKKEREKKRKSNVNNLSEFFPRKLTHFIYTFPLLLLFLLLLLASVVVMVVVSSRACQASRL